MGRNYSDIEVNNMLNSPGDDKKINFEEFKASFMNF